MAELELTPRRAQRGARRLGRPCGVRRGRARLRQKRPPGCGELYAGGHPLQEGPAQLALEGAHLLREGWLGDRQPLGRACEGSLLDDGEQVVDLAEIHEFGCP